MITITLAFGSMKSFFSLLSIRYSSCSIRKPVLTLPAEQDSRTTEQEMPKLSAHVRSSQRGGPFGAQSPPVVVLKYPQMLQYSSLQEVEPNFPPL